MLSLILAVSLSQVYRSDFYFSQAQEAWVVDHLEQPQDWLDVVPEQIGDQIRLWNSESSQVRRSASDRLAAIGADAVRWLFWATKAKDQRIAMRAESVLLRITTCRWCDGTGECQTFMAKDPETVFCDRCRHEKMYHASNGRPCVHCRGDGYLEEPYRW